MRYPCTGIDANTDREPFINTDTAVIYRGYLAHKKLAPPLGPP